MTTTRQRRFILSKIYWGFIVGARVILVVVTKLDQSEGVRAWSRENLSLTHVGCQ